MTTQIYIYIYILVQVTPGVIINNVTLINIFYVDVNFDKLTIELHYLYIFSILAKFHSDQRLIVMSSFNCINSSFYSLK